LPRHKPPRDDTCKFDYHIVNHTRKHLPTLFRTLFNLFMAGVVAFSFLLQAGGVSAGPQRDDPAPDGTAPASAAPGWLDMVTSPEGLYSEYELEILAGRLILVGKVTASNCPNGGLLENGVASQCGVQAALPEVFKWQNRFNQAILAASQQSGVPPVLLKNVFAWESQFWPTTIFVYTSEYGLGHLTDMGADSALRWNYAFYQSVCRDSFTPENCEKYYVDQTEAIQSALRGVVLQRVNADCANCEFGLDLKKAESSIPVFATTMLANSRVVKLYIERFTGSKASEVVSDEDLWKFTLSSYNAGPGCFKSALARTYYAKQSINWNNLSSNFDLGCRGAKPYVDFVSGTAQYHPDHAPVIQPTPAATESTPETATETPAESATPETTSTTETVTSPTAAPSETEIVSQTATVEPTGTPEPSSGETITPAVELLSATPEATATETTAPAVELPSSTPEATAAETATPEPPTATPTVTETITGLPTDVPQSDMGSEELVVKFKNFPASLFSGLVLSSVGATVEQTVDPLGAVVVSVPEGQTSAVLEQLNNNLLVDYAEPNYVVQVFFTPNDPGFTQQSDSLTSMQIPDAWDITQGSGAVVAIIDTGVDTIHPDLTSALWTNPGETGFDASGNNKRANSLDDDNNGYVDDWQGWNFTAGTNNPGDDNSHGTHIAGIIAARIDNNEGIAGIAPQAQVMALKALDAGGHGTYASVAEAIYYAVDHGAQIINLGFGGTDSSQALLDATDYAFDNGVLVIAAGGNTGDGTVFFPAANPNVLAVSALDGSLDPAPFSSFNDSISLSAPGVNVYATLPGSQYGTLSGTSMSAAEVSGAAALLASLPEFDTAAAIREALVGAAFDLGAPGWDASYGYGLVHALDALNYVPGQLPTPTTSPTPDGSPTPTATPGDGGVDIMAVAPGTAWTNINATAPNNQTGTVTSTNTFAAGAGTNRILLVGVICEINNAAQAMTTLTATYGGVALTQLATTRTSANREHVWVGYLLDAQIPAGAQNVVVTYNTGSGTNTLAALHIKAATYTGVNQTTPFNGSNANFSADTTVATNAAINYVADGLTFFITGNGGNNATETITATPALTEVNRTASTQTSFAGASAVHVAAGTYASGGISITFAGGTSTRSALVVGTLNPAPVNIPTLTSPTATSITDTTATLGANNANQGGSAITVRGTCWGTTAAPITNCLAEGGTATGVFTQSRTGLPPGTLIYYRAYATNSFGTGYSPDGSFYTEPATQASGVNFTAVGLNSMTVSWTRGSGDGVIVLIHAGLPVDSDPLDGTYTSYVPNTAFGSGTQIGTGNYVIYKGAGTNVTVTGLSSGTTYYVAVYEYAGAVDTAGVNQGTNYKPTPATGSQATIALYLPPTLTISSPVDGASFQQGTTVGFAGSATIQTSGDISRSIVWREGATTIGTGSSFGISTFGLGAHTITASVTDTNSGLTTTVSITINISAIPAPGVSPHGMFNASTDTCAVCHRSHSAQSWGPLITYPDSPYENNNFCMSCHGSGSNAISTHSNRDSVAIEQSFELLCIQCHDPHGNSPNLANIRKNAVMGTLPNTYDNMVASSSQMVFTATTGTGSFDDGTSAAGSRLCVTCHQDAANPGAPMSIHTGGAGHSGGISYTGQDCTSCHPHSLDTDPVTRDGFTTSCRACHSQPQDAGQGTPRRQIVGYPNGAGGNNNDFMRASHHVSGNDTATEADCKTCHELSQHRLGKVRLYNQDNSATVYTLDYRVNAADDPADYEAFCLSCHDANGQSGNTTPFSDKKLIPQIDTSLWSASQHNIIKLTFSASCLDCHSNGHGSNKTYMQSSFSTTAPWDWAFLGSGTAPADVMDQEEDFCFKCHQTGSATGTPVQAAFTSYANTATRLFKHDVSNTYTKHDPNEVFSSLFGGTNRHIECGDCHGSHEDKAGSSLAPTVKPENIGASGVEPVYSGTGAPIRFNFLDRVTYEYQFCFKCHSSYTTLSTYRPDGVQNATTPAYTTDGLWKLDRTTRGQISESRDLALEFNPAEASFHPVEAVGKNTTWTANTWAAGAATAGSTMCGGAPCSATSRLFCTDCHANANPAIGANGPHGSPRLHILKGTADYITDDNDNDITHSSNELCFQCHAYATYFTGNNDRFGEHDRHDFAACYDCHDTHGSQNPHLINFNADHMTFNNGKNSITAYTHGTTVNTGSCDVACHGHNHNDTNYP
jgi:thermitase